eukprot:4639656-Prymnesium_polylepis.2
MGAGGHSRRQIRPASERCAHAHLVLRVLKEHAVEVNYLHLLELLQNREHRRILQPASDLQACGAAKRSGAQAVRARRRSKACGAHRRELRPPGTFRRTCSGRPFVSETQSSTTGALLRLWLPRATTYASA